MQAGWWNEYGTDAITFGLSTALLAGYHLYLVYRLRHDSSYTIQAINRAARSAWVENIMEHDGQAIVGVQTLRNSTMAATFLASTAVLLIMGTLTLTEQADKLAASFHTISVLGSHHPGLWVTKSLLLVADFFIAFFSFSMAIRMFNHVGYLIGVPAERRPKALTAKRVAVHLNRAGSYYSLGMRAYYISVPLVFWLFGPHLMLGATLVLIAVLYRLDRAPPTH
ncbi:MAG: DUF599 domain-containing protein [Gammaproteobacteria bacterium]